MTSNTGLGGRFGFLLAALAAGLQPAAAQRPIAAEGDYVHGPARAVYPVRIGGFKRSEIYQYDEAGKDLSASYNLATPAGRLLITVYIYPAPAASPSARSEVCDREFEAVGTTISSQHGNVAPAEQGSAIRVKGISRRLAHRAAYRFSIPFDDRVQEIRSEAHLYCYVGGDWLVKYRISAPVAVKTRGHVEAFIRDGPWPGRSSS